ncbi:signal recognition particle-docking protein FtsY [Helicobacter monodelphidis]|uniref:signal recognition particle-docking protein FtsY n=1 Tax=Helicobacter sp. 15-1451 TaxID=2004995 RepID=UPI000DCC3FEB|nr:signal recognition particle-docking protein FtsY [Helicobacter sp. 15-1451]RAX58956.1 signal recognition particle-docking protein FtsY [Helicobacter sp. 15-1451]
MLGIFKKGLAKTLEKLNEIAPKRSVKIHKEVLEELLIASDIEYELVELILEHLSDEVSRNELEVALLNLFRGESFYDRVVAKEIQAKPCVRLIMGVNGAGKTTTIAKLTQRFKQEGKSVLLGAGDTFRAAAIEQLSLWAKKLEVPIVYSQQGHDPSAVAFDAITSGLAKNVDEILIDTAGRLHNQTNLKNELVKIARICDKALKGAPHQKILIIDGTQGSSAIAQAKVFEEALGIDGVIVTKLDGTSKGGALISIMKELRVPILFVGVGEKAQDLVPFVQEEYINSLLDGLFADS